MVQRATAGSVTDTVGKNDWIDIRRRRTDCLDWREVWKDVVAGVSAFERGPVVSGTRRGATGDVVRFIEGGIH